MDTAEEIRLKENYSGQKKWLKWGPYLAERQWGTVREDYSANGDVWDYFTHDDARSRAYRWGEDGIAGLSDSRQRLCFALALWNGKDAILKERLFGLTGKEGNHGEDVKELYYYLDNTPSHSYQKYLYKYPQAAFPYKELVEVNGSRSKQQGEYEILDTGLFNNHQYFDVYTEYAKNDDEDISIRITIYNRAKEAAALSVLPTLWLRNGWSFELESEKPVIRLQQRAAEFGEVVATHFSLGRYHFYFEPAKHTLFTENESNKEKLFGSPNDTPFVKDAFHAAVTQNRFEAFAGKQSGTKFSPVYQYNLEAGAVVTIRLRLSEQALAAPFDESFEAGFTRRIAEADEFYNHLSKAKDADEKNIQRQAFAGLLWTKQYYHIDIPRWLEGDPGQPPPPSQRKHGRNHKWKTLNNEDIISMPDAWEYPWYAAWDLAFHCVPLAMLDARFAKNQLILLLREWYMNPQGQLPAYEWNFSDLNPPVHAWSCFEVYKIDKDKTGVGDYNFLERVFQKLLINFTWWVNRKDHKDDNIFEGGFLGLDNIGVFDRSNAVPGGGQLEQADATAWMAMYCLNMLEIALELSQVNNAYEDVATKFLEHFIYITDALNRINEDWTGSWDEEQGFFYDILSLPDGRYIPLKIRSLVGLTTLFSVLVIDKSKLEKLPEFYRRLKWFRKYREENGEYKVIKDDSDNDGILLSLVPRERLERLMEALLDENEFLSPAGIRSLSKIHQTPFTVDIDGEDFSLRYQPGESGSDMYGGNSNWRGPVWMPMNYLLILSLKKYGNYYKDEVTVAYPAGSGNCISLGEVSRELCKRVLSVFLKDKEGKRLVHGNAALYHESPEFSNLVLFYEYFHGDTGWGLGASHQTGWTGVVAELINRIQEV